ncbi:protein PFC0760c-like [Maniola hyperantus]|uniref:protein PFC0760c-like n=1 Tax=Aphantopus hyperantus TaxID=2795564 RepID=UPI0037496F9C
MNLRIRNLFLIFWLLNTVKENVGLIPQPNLINKLLKTLRSVDAATSDVTSNLIKSLCSCLREKLKKHEEFHGETNSLLYEDEADQESDINFYKNMYNRTCTDLDQASKDNNTEIVKNNGETVLNKDLKNDINPIKQYQNSTEHPSNKEYRLLYHVLIKGINDYIYKIQKYPLYKQKVSFNSRDERDVIVIITLQTLLNNSNLQHSLYNVNENEVNETLRRNSLVDIHIIDSMFTNENELISTVKKCHLYSLYIFLIESQRKNSIKNLKVLHVKDTIKIYINVLSNLNLKNFPDQCCNKSLLTICKNRIYSERNEFMDKDQIKYKSEQHNDNNFKNIVSNIKNLINLYNAKITQKDIPDEKFISNNCNESQYLSEKSLPTTILSSIATDIPWVAKIFTTEKNVKITKENYLLDFGGYALTNNTLPNATTVNKDEQIPSNNITYTASVSLQEENRKLKIVQNIENNFKVGDNLVDYFTEKTFLRNEVIDKTSIENKTITKLLVIPIGLSPSADLENHTTLLSLSQAVDIKFGNEQRLQTETPALYTPFYKINEENQTQLDLNKFEPSLATYIKTSTENKSFNVSNTIGERPEEKNIQPKVTKNNWSNFTLKDNLTQIVTENFSLANKTIDLSVIKGENKNRTDFLVTPSQSTLHVVYLENHTTVLPLSRATEIKLQNAQLLQTAAPTLSTASFIPSEENKKQTTNKLKSSLSTDIVTKNKSIIVPHTMTRKPHKENMKPQIMENALSNLILGDNSTKKVNTLLLNQATDKTTIRLPVSPTQFLLPLEQDLTTVVSLPGKKNINMQNAQMLPKVKPLISTVSYKVHEENQRRTDVNKFEPSLIRYDITNMENESTIAPNIIKRRTQKENKTQQIMEKSILKVNISVANETIDLSTTKGDNKTRIDLPVPTILFALPEEFESYITVVPLARVKDKENVQSTR